MQSLQLFRRRYGFSLLVIALLATGGQGLIQWALSASVDDGALINRAGRQRILSQRIAEEILSYANFSPDPAVRAELATTLDDWERSHRFLQNTGAGPAVRELSPALRAEFAALQPLFESLVADVKRFLDAEAGTAEARRAEEAFMAGENGFLAAMNGIVATAEREAAARVQRIRALEVALWVVTLLALGLEARVVFRPFAKRMSATMGENERLSEVARLMPSMVIITGARGVIEWVNPAFERGSGFTRAEAVGKRPGQLLQGPETDRATVQRMRTKLVAGEAVGVEVVNYRKDGENICRASISARSAMRAGRSRGSSGCRTTRPSGPR